MTIEGSHSALYVEADIGAEAQVPLPLFPDMFKKMVFRCTTPSKVQDLLLVFRIISIVGKSPGPLQNVMHIRPESPGKHGKYRT